MLQVSHTSREWIATSGDILSDVFSYSYRIVATFTYPSTAPCFNNSWATSLCPSDVATWNGVKSPSPRMCTSAPCLSRVCTDARCPACESMYKGVSLSTDRASMLAPYSRRSSMTSGEWAAQCNAVQPQHVRCGMRQPVPRDRPTHP